MLEPINAFRDVIPLLVAAVWPSTTLILFFFFRHRIRDLISSVTELKVGDRVTVKWGQAPSDKIKHESPARGSGDEAFNRVSNPKWDNVANLFWLGNDLEWTAQTVLRGAPKVKILHGLSHCYFHSGEVGLGESNPGKQLVSLKSYVDGLPEEALDKPWRISFSEQLYGVVREFDFLMRRKQPNFKPPEDKG